MKLKALTAAFAATIMALSSVTASANAAEVYEENVSPASTYSIVTYNRYENILEQSQTTPYSCATACAAMCVNKDLEGDLKADGFNINYADWYGIGNKYGYSVEWLGRADINGTTDGLKKIYNYLKSGYPVCVWINSTTSGTHWVTVYRYSGDGVNFKASDFDCIDPARCWYDPDHPEDTTRDRKLSQAFNYAGVYNTVVFK